MPKKRIVVLGGGFAGVIFCQEMLRKSKEFDIFLVDKNNFFSFTPMIVETVSGSISHSNIVHPLRKIFGNRITILKDTVRSVNLDKKTVKLSKCAIDYDILVIAIGSAVNYLGIPGAKEHSLPIRNVHDSIDAHNRIIEQFENGSGPEAHKFAVVGAGPAGTELACEIDDLIHKEMRRQFPNITESGVVLIDRNERVLASLEKILSDKATAVLRKKNIQLKLGKRVIKATADSIIIEDGTRIGTKTIFWTAGMKASPLKIIPAIEHDKMDRIMVDGTFLIKGQQDAYAIGDIANITDPKSAMPLPMTAQIAEKEAKHLARIITGSTDERFIFKQTGFFVSLGRYNAVGITKGITFSGILAWFIWRTIYLFKLRSTRKKIRVAFDWTINLFTGRDTSQL